MLDMERLRELDPEGWSACSSVAFVALLELEECILDRLERLMDNGTLDLLGVLARAANLP